MKAAYSQSKEPGYGTFILTQEVFPEGPWQIAIERGSDRQFMTGNPAQPWSGEAKFMAANSAVQPDGSLAIDVGPEIVDLLDQQEAYRVQLKGSTGDPVKARLAIDAITHSPAGSLENTARPAEETKAESARDAESVNTSKSVQPEPVPEPAPAPAPEQAPERLDLEQPKPERKHAWWRLGIIAALIIGCLAWYWLDPRFKNEGTEVPQPLSAEEQVRKFFSSPDPDGQAAMALAAKLPDTTAADQDAIFRLYYFAAEKKVPGAALAYGGCLDPSKPVCGSVEKSGSDAWNAYKRATDHMKGGQAMMTLRSWLVKESRSGNAQAAKWLREIEN